MGRPARTTDVVVEQGAKRTFAAALDWPGWARAGRTPEQALEALDAYAGRYRAALEAVGLSLPAAAERRLVVVETVPGDATTDFGAPSRPAAADSRPVTAADARRLVGAVEAGWAALAAAAAAAPPALRKGPRGGGRDRDAVVAHVAGADAAYAPKLGVRRPGKAWATPEGLAEGRAAVLAVLAAPSDGGLVREGGWSARYAARRIAWHALDHAWEIEDRAGA